MYGFHENRLQMIQLRNKLSEKAAKCGIRNFPAMFDEYVKSMSKVGNSMKGEGTTDFNGQDKPLKCGTWEATDSGISNVDRFGNDVQACPHPIYPLRILTNIDTHLEKVELKWRRGNDPWKSHMFPKSTVCNASSIVKLADYGIAVTSENAKPLVRYLNDVESLNYEDLERSNSVGRLGWIENYGFSPYIENLRFDGEDEYADRFAAVSERGSYEKWLEAMRSFRRFEHPIVRIIFAASLASALVYPAGIMPFFVHLWGKGGSGKTVVTQVAASIWANPEMGRYIKSFNGTGVGKELGAVFLNSLPMFLDELQIAPNDKNKLRQMVYELTEGFGRERGRKEGGLQKAGTWRNCTITTGEQPLIESNWTEGAKYRTIEIKCNNIRFFESGNCVGANAKEVSAFIQKNFGFMGRRFIEQLQANGVEGFKPMHNALTDEIMRMADVDSKQALPAALILVADRLVERWFFHDSIVLEPRDIVPYLVTKGDADQDKRAFEFLQEAASIYRMHFEPDDEGLKTEVWGEIKQTRDGRDWLVLYPSKFTYLLESGGFPVGKFIEYARTNGLLRLDNGGKSTYPAKIAGAKKAVRCYWVLLVDEPSEDEGGASQAGYHGSMKML